MSKKPAAARPRPPQRGGEIKIWDVQTKALLNTLTGHKDCIYAVAWSPDGKLLASGSYDKMVKLWDANTGKELKNLQDHIDAVFCVAFSPDGKRLASGSQDRSVKIWDITTGQRLYTLSDASDGIHRYGVFSLWKADRGRGLRQNNLCFGTLVIMTVTWCIPLIADEDSILSLAWTPDGTTLIKLLRRLHPLSQLLDARPPQCTRPPAGMG